MRTTGGIVEIHRLSAHLTPTFPSRNLLKSSRRGPAAERDGVPEGSSTSVGFPNVRTTSTRLLPRVGRAGGTGVLFENSIVCLVVFLVCCFCFLPRFFFPFRGVACFFASFDWLLGQIFLNGFCLESLILAQDERWRRA